MRLLVRKPASFRGDALRKSYEYQAGEGEEEEVWEAECVMARRRLKPEMEGGPPGEWQYLIRWVGKPAEEDRWVPESAIDPDFLREDLDAAATERAMERASISPKAGEE